MPTRNAPVRRYTYGGRVAHLLQYEIDLAMLPYTQAYCGYSPRFGVYWLGSGTQDEEDRSNKLPLCAQCADRAAEFQRYVEGRI